MGSRSFRLEGPARRIAIAIAVIVALVVVAIAIVIWRYEASRDSDNAALRESQTQLVAQQARTALTDEGGIVAGYASNKDPADLFALQGRRRQLRRALDTLQQSDALSAAELDRVRQIEAGQERLDGLFTDNVLPVAGTRRFDTGVKPFEAAVTKLEAKLDAFIAALGDDSARAAAAARSDASEAKTIAIIAAALAALAALAAGIYIVRLIGLLLERIRTSASTLAEMAVEMRAGSAEAATATNRQSTAIAEVAATAEELSATAASIADNAKAGTTAVERTGDVMGTMQGQVQAISDRSLALGERSQRIGEVLELINEIAEQTNLLALNAAIEAARAGEAGKGFAVVASEVRKLAERSIRSTDEIREILTSVQDETSATISATEQGAEQAREVGTLMGSTAEVLEESLRATEQQREAAEQVSSSIVQVRTATEKLAAELEERSARSEQLEALVGQLERTLVEHGLAVRGGDGAVVRRRER